MSGRFADGIGSAFTDDGAALRVHSRSRTQPAEARSHGQISAAPLGTLRPPRSGTAQTPSSAYAPSFPIGGSDDPGRIGARNRLPLSNQLGHRVRTHMIWARECGTKEKEGGPEPALLFSYV